MRCAALVERLRDLVCRGEPADEEGAIGPCGGTTTGSSFVCRSTTQRAGVAAETMHAREHRLATDRSPFAIQTNSR